MATNPKIQQKADDIRNKVYGREVREALASGLEVMSEDVEDIKGRQESVESQFQAVLDETTGKDVISAPEILAARVSADGTNHANLKERLDKEHQEVTAQLAHMENKKADKEDVSNFEKDQFDGQLIKQIRTPTLVVEDQFPNKHVSNSIVWADGDEMYMFGNDRVLRKSVDGGKTWVDKTKSQFDSKNGKGCFLKLPDGTLLTLAQTGDRIFRSTDDGESWDVCFNFGPSRSLLGPQSWCYEPNGNVYIAEYITNVADADNIAIWKSTDSGATWNVLKSWKGYAHGDNVELRHIHACQYDPISDRVYFSTGDGEIESGIYRTTADRNGVEEVFVPRLPMNQNQVARCIGFMFFENYIAWGGDSTSSKYLYRLKRTDIGKNDVNLLETIYRLNGTSWWTQKANKDGSEWILSVSQEGSDIDNSSHIMLVTDEGSKVFELGAIPASGSGTSLAPLGGIPEKGGDSFWLTGFRTEYNFQIKCRIARSFVGINIPERFRGPNIAEKITQSSGLVSLEAGETKTFARTSAPFHPYTTLYIFSVGATKINGNGWPRLKIINRSTGDIIVDTADTEYKLYQRKADSQYLFKVSAPGSVNIDFQLYESGGLASAEGTAYVTYGWGIA